MSASVRRNAAMMKPAHTVKASIRARYTAMFYPQVIYSPPSPKHAHQSRPKSRLSAHMVAWWADASPPGGRPD